MTDFVLQMKLLYVEDSKVHSCPLNMIVVVVINGAGRGKYGCGEGYLW